LIGGRDKADHVIDDLADLEKPCLDAPSSLLVLEPLQRV